MRPPRKKTPMGELRKLTYILAGIGGIIWGMNTPVAHAAGTCEARSAEHAAQAHTTREGDSRWHVAHGQLPTCGLDKSSDDRDQGHGAEDRDRGPRKDHPGFHCTWHGCG